MIITRYALHKITGINESVFSQMWKRQLSGKDFYSFFTEDGKVDIDDNGFILKYSSKVIPEELEKLKNKKKPKTKNTVIKKEILKKNITKKNITKKKIKTEKPVYHKKNKYEDPGKDEELSALARRATIAKHKSDIYKSEKAEMDLRQSRSQLVELETLGKALIGYCIALNQNILDQPRSFVDKFESAMKTGKSKTILTDILREPITESITDTMEAMKKEIAKYKRDIKSDNNDE